MKRVGVACGSLCVLAIAGTFVVAPSSPALAVTPAHAVSVAADDAVIFGTVLDASGHPQAGVTVSVTRSRSRWQHPATTRTDATGGYRLEIAAHCQAVTVTMRTASKRRPVTGSQSFAVCPGTSYGLSASLSLGAELVFSRVQRYPLASQRTTVSGRISYDDGVGVPGASVLVFSSGHGRDSLVASTTTDAHGDYRLSFRGHCGFYDVLISVPTGDRPLSATTRARMCPGSGYVVDAQIRRSPQFVFLPVTSY